MNVTELARILKVTPQELRDYLPQFGFDIGQKAIKINRNVANKIIKEWPVLKKKIERKKEEERLKQEEKKKITVEKKTLVLPEYITIREFAALSGAPINAVLSELMKNGIFASLNEKIDYETAWLVGSEMGLEIKKGENEQAETGKNTNKLKEILESENKEKMELRPPVIVIMGHVDHGKTLLLDAIRKTNVVEGEAGGITQHIGAYQVERRKRLITFIDTPGHEAFTAMRSRGAKIADVAVLVVAADDGVKPQTTEAFRIIEASGVPFVVAINKIDKPEANIDKTKQELSNQLNIIPEDWGGKTICVPVSAKAGTGITDLLDMVLLTADTDAQNLKANPEAKAIGTVIESNIDKGAGPIATILIQNGTLRTGDQLILDNVNIGRVRGLSNYNGEKIESAGPATPTRVIGLKIAPQVGDMVEVGTGEKIKYKKIKTVAKKETAADIKTEEEDESNKINIIVKSDVLGSAEAIEESLEKINTKDVKIKIIHKGLGNVTEGDIKKAEASNAAVIAFNVKIPAAAQEVARECGVEIKTYNIIYNLLGDMKEEIKKHLKIELVKKEVARMEVMAVFKTDKEGQILGGKITAGRIEPGIIIEIMRHNEFEGAGKLVKIQSGKQDVNSAEAGQECGIRYEGRAAAQVGDILVFFKEVEEKK